ncbi:hypothetical protein M758_7G017000 [Ceratodon purpureus]|nr:hypothetical protein M758_7G017000 [Ceratodon purpureus]
MAPGMVSSDVEVKRGRGRPPKVKGMLSPAISESAPLTPECNPKVSTFTPPTPVCVVPYAERVRPRRLFEGEEKRAECVTPVKSVRSTPKKSAGGTPRTTPKKAKAKDRGFEDGEEDDVPEIRKSPRLTRSASKCLNETPKRGRGRPRKILGEEVELKNRGHRGSRNLTRRTGESLSEGQVRRCVKKVVFEGVEYQVGDDVYVRRGAKGNAENGVDGNAEWSDSDAEVEDCVLCGRSGEDVMIECDECLGGYHLHCLEPPLEEVPEGDWMCATCAALARGENVERPSRQKRTRRTARERFIAQEIWAARIEKLWRDKDGTMYFQGRWWALPEETADGRQQWHGRRELFRSNHADENEMDTILRHCYVMTPDQYAKSGHEGDDVFMCGHEYDFRHQTFKRIADEFDDVSDVDDSEDESFDPTRKSKHHDLDQESDDDDDDFDNEFDDELSKPRSTSKNKSRSRPVTPKAANVRKGHVKRIEGVGAKLIPRARKKPLTDLEKAKAALGLSAAPTTLPCRDREKSEIEAFVKDAVAAGEECLGRCLYISGVPGTGKTATVLEVMKGLREKVDKGELPPYRFVEINGLRLPSPEHAYTVLHEALTGQHCGWRRAVQYLDARFSDSKPLKGVNARPCILLVDELDLLVTRSQSVLYNLFDWPSRANSRLIVIGIANTMDLPERMLPRIASRLGLHRISFGPYSHTQLQQILATRLEGIPAFDKQAVEFASRKVAAVSGDARRALELCRRAAEITELRINPPTTSFTTTEPAPPSVAVSPQGEGTTTPQAPSQLIGMSDIEAAISEMFQAPHIQFMKRCSMYSKIFLVAMVIEQHRTTMVETTFEKVVTAFMRLCTTHKVTCPGEDSILTVGCKLGASRLLLCEPAIRHRHQKLQLNFPCDDVQFALKDDKELPWMSKYL